MTDLHELAEALRARGVAASVDGDGVPGRLPEQMTATWSCRDGGCLCIVHDDSNGQFDVVPGTCPQRAPRC